MLSGDAASAIKDGEQSLNLAGPQASSDLTCSLLPLLSQAYESNQNIGKHDLKAAEYQQKFINNCGSYLTPDQRTRAQQRLAVLQSKASDQKR